MSCRNLKVILFKALVFGILPTQLAYSHGPHSYDELAQNLPTLHTIQSSYPNEIREFHVQLPISYEFYPQDRYPVLYMLDADRPFIFRETINITNTLIDRHKMPELIIVFLPNSSGEARSRDYTPSQQADQFLDFIEFELLPYIDANFRTEPLNILSGESRSGLLVVHSLLNRPHLFGAHIATSPALWHDDNMVISEARQFLQSTDSLRNFLYMNIGGEENENISNSFDRMDFVLRRMAPAGLNWQADFAEFESHGTTRPLGHYIALRKFFTNWDKPWNDIPTFDVFDEKGGLDMMINRYQALSAEYGYTVKPIGLIDAANYYLSIGEANEAIRILNANTEYYPNSVEAFLELSKAYYATGDRESTLQSAGSAEIVAKNTGDTKGLEAIEEFLQLVNN